MGIRVRALQALLVVPLLAAGLAMGSAKPASAATVCNTGVNGTQTGTIKDSIVVQANTTCVLMNAVVRGGVTVELGGYFFAENTQIRGSVTGNNVLNVYIRGGSVRGGVTVTGANIAEVYPTEIRGHVVLSGATGYALLGPSVVDGNVTIDNNATAWVLGNTIALSLSCTGNGTISNNGQDNSVGGTESGQCVGF